MNPLVVVCIVLLVIVLAGGFHPSLTQNYGYWPGGAVSLVLIIVLVLLITGRF